MQCCMLHVAARHQARGYEYGRGADPAGEAIRSIRRRSGSLAVWGSIDPNASVVRWDQADISTVAELERNIVRERVTAGLRRAKKEGAKRLADRE